MALSQDNNQRFRKNQYLQKAEGLRLLIFDLPDILFIITSTLAMIKGAGSLFEVTLKTKSKEEEM
jgi:hypothetical protein